MEAQRIYNLFSEYPGVARQMRVSTTELQASANNIKPLPCSDADVAVLEALAEEAVPIVAHIGKTEFTFRSRVRFVDPSRQFIVLDLSAAAPCNAALLAQSRVTFISELDEWRIEFVAMAPERGDHDGNAVIRMRFPESIYSRRRRMQERAPVALQSAIRCVTYDAGVATFEGTIFDISQGGVGVLQYGSESPLNPGTVIKNCCIERPGKETITVNLEVRFTEFVTLPDGERAQRAGCRFVNWSPAAMALIAEIVEKKS